MSKPRIAVVGIPGKWSTEALARAVAERLGACPVIDMGAAELRLGLAFLGGEFLAAYTRVSGRASWNTTIRAGGKYAPGDPSPEIVALAERAQAPFGLDFTTVDIADTQDGSVVFEVSAFGGFRGVFKGAGVDAAAACADYAIAQLP